MAKRGDVIEHPVTGERFALLKTAQDTGGEYSRYEVRVRPRGFVAAPHIHPFVEESFEIRAGTWAFVVDGEESRVGPGEGAIVPVGTPHAWWNAGEEEGVAIVEFRPALKADEFFESFFGLAQDGKVSPKTGLPNLLWMALILSYYRDFLYLARPSLFVQRAVFTPLAVVAKLFGYRLPYPYPYGSPRGAKPRTTLAGRRKDITANPGRERSEA
jgi:mannose-6-phosphate isomerase-like protein (cupin superfamily)